MSDELNQLDRALDGLRDCKSVAAELARQPEFFSLYRDDLPDLESKRPVLALSRYNGARSGDEQVNLRVGAMRLLGFSDRNIERECGVDRRTIPHRLHWLEQAKLLPALKDRVSMHTGNLAERSALVLSALLDRAQDEVSVELAGMIKAVATAHGITVEKMQLLTGLPTEIVGHVGADGRGAIEAWAKEIGAAIEVETVRADLQSGDGLAIPAGTDAIPASGHGVDTASDPNGRPPGQPTDPSREERDGGGGGLAGGGGAESRMG